MIAPYLASHLMREPDPSSVLLMAKRAGNKQTISLLKQLAKAFQFFIIIQVTMPPPESPAWKHIVKDCYLEFDCHFTQSLTFNISQKAAWERPSACTVEPSSAGLPGYIYISYLLNGLIIFSNLEPYCIGSIRAVAFTTWILFWKNFVWSPIWLCIWVNFSMTGICALRGHLKQNEGSLWPSLIS